MFPDDVVAVTPDSVLWLGTRGGVSRFDGLTWTSYTTTADGLVHDTISVVEVAPDGAVWFGIEGGLMRKAPVPAETLLPTNTPVSTEPPQGGG